MMLTRSDGTFFSRGCLPYLDQRPDEPDGNSKIHLPVRFLNRDLSIRTLCLIDTRADWSALDWSLAQQLGCQDLPSCGEVTDLTRFGRLKGQLFRLGFSIEAEEGESMEAEGAFWVSEEWTTGISILGFNGFLSHLRFAVDPFKNRFYFGCG